MPGDDQLDPMAMRVVAMAIGAAGEVGDDTEGWRTRVAMLVPQVASMLRPHSEQAKQAVAMIGASSFLATYDGYEYEPSSTRCKITLITEPSRHYPDGREPLRTQRTDEPLGAAQRAWLDANFTKGDAVRAWKHNEQISHDGDKVRVLVHMEKVVRKNVRPSAPPQRPGGPGAGAPARGLPPASAEGPAPSTHMPSDGHTTGSQFVEPVAAVVRGLLRQVTDPAELEKRRDLLRKHGWETADDIPEDQKEKAMYIARHGRDDFF